jgi:hypothetical protein
MQFLVYLALLIVSVSSVLLEVHWLTSPAPQPKQIAQASSPPTPKTERANAERGAVYPKTADAPRSAENDVQAKITSAATPRAAGHDTAPTESRTPEEQVLPQSSHRMETAQPIQQPAAIPQPHQVALPQTPTSRFSGTNEGSRHKSSAELTGVTALSEDNTKQPAANTPGPMNRVGGPQQSPQDSSNNRCDVQACAKAYRSFRATDCTYQPLDGQRRFCGTPQGQQLARAPGEWRERRRWNRDTDVDRSTVGRRLDDDDEDHQEFENSDREPLGFFLFGRRPRW